MTHTGKPIAGAISSILKGDQWNSIKVSSSTFVADIYLPLHVICISLINPNWHIMSRGRHYPTLGIGQSLVKDMSFLHNSSLVILLSWITTNWHNKDTVLIKFISWWGVVFRKSSLSCASITQCSCYFIFIQWQLCYSIQVTISSNFKVPHH